MELTKAQNRYNKFFPVFLWTVFALILVGGLVRSTGSGMGCPDWPKCFGQYVPPTDISQLPANYKEMYAVAGRVIADFSPIKTWTEYMNRLFGAWTGIAALILSYFAFAYKENKKIFWHTHGSLFLVILNGWLGSKVVSTHLMPGVITAHMILAVALIFVLLRIKHFISFNSENLITEKVDLDKYHQVAIGLIFLIGAQIIFGTQVREQIDHITNTMPDLARSQWVENLGTIFYIHRSFSILLVLGIFYLIRRVMTETKNNYAQKLSINIALVCFAEIAAGVTLAYIKFPAISQPIHLFLAVLLASYLYDMYLLIKESLQRQTHA
jgi:cytochrome c oxidase assembly protein subunit 15